MAVTVSVWMESSPEELKSQMSIHSGASSVQHELSSKQKLTPLVVGLGTLDPTVSKTLQDVKIPASRAKEWARSGFSGLTGMAKSAELLMAIGSYYLMNESMIKNFKAVEDVAGEKSLEVMLAFQSSSLGVLGGGLEIIGIVLQRSHKDMINKGLGTSNEQAGVKKSIESGRFIARTGAVISAFSGMLDAVQAGFSASRSYKAGDNLPAFNYGVSAAASALGAGFAMYAGALGMSAIISSLGVAIIFGLIGYFLFRLAEGGESSPIEKWSRRSYFGKSNEIPKLHWDSAIHASTAMAELNSAILGLDAAIMIISRASNAGKQDLSGFGPLSIPKMDTFLKYKIILPNFDENRSAYRWSLISMISSNNSHANLTNDILVAEGQTHTSSLTGIGLGIEHSTHLVLEHKTLEKFIESASCEKSVHITTLQSGSNIKTLEIRGEIKLKLGYKNYLPCDPLLILNYWPDYSVPDGYAGLIKN